MKAIHILVHGMPQARSQSGYVAELQDMVEELQAAQSLVQDQKHSHQAEVCLRPVACRQWCLCTWLDCEFCTDLSSLYPADC